MGEVFANRNFRRLFLGNLFSGFGQGMTMIGIAWYMVQTTGTATLLGSTMFCSGLLMFLIGPYLGTLIDRYSRKKILLAENIVGFLVLFLLTIWGYFGEYTNGSLIVIYLVTTLIFQVHYPAQTALVQEQFEPKSYHAINSLLEIESQTSSVLAGGVAGFLLGLIGLQYVLFFNALTYLFAFLMVCRISYSFTLEKNISRNNHNSWVGQFMQSWHFVREKQGFFLFGIAVMIPFVAVMVTNFLGPVFVVQTLKEDVLIYSFGEVTYSIGAIIAGVYTYHVMKRLGEYASMIGNILIFALGFAGMIIFQVGWVYVAMYIIVGWANASTRLIRQSLYMKLIPKELMGRVMSFFTLVGLFMRLILIGLFTVITDTTGAVLGHIILIGLLLLGVLGIMRSLRPLLQESVERST
ncbi:MFS transporter [Brevibacillus laterosporus]|uniref:MFS transporter n=1 Tax=Brevibacillus laterosporus TaxID=1465 RepID=UPI0018F891C1|nr:MFS transporter [Brevibacillus laterosporus]MBG9776030.1 MFS transporter [Brevibacillus laterosporus]